MQSPSLRRLISLLSTGALIASMAVATTPAAALAAAPPAPYFNGFENPGDAITGTTADTQAMFDVTRVASGTSITAASGGSYAQAAINDYYTGTLNQFTRLGGYSSTFPAGGYTTSADIYLDMSLATGSNDLRFDWSSAISGTSVPTTHRRDFIFSVGTNPTAAGQFIISASNNAPGHPAGGLSPLTISTSGWYTFQHRFYDKGEGVLAVDLTVRTIGSATPLWTWTLTDPTDIIGGTVGGNRYGWLVRNDFEGLALDNISRSGTSLGACPVSITGSSPTVYTLLENCTTDQTITVPQNSGGSTFDGNSRSVTGVDPTGGHFVGAVIQAAPGASAITVKNLTVTVSGLTNACDAGVDRLRGILFDGVGGAITNNQVISLKQGTNSGCQEGNAIEARNAPFDTGGPDKTVAITANTVTDYQKTGILANGSVAATITNNVIVGAGPIAYIAQNGIQVGFGATAIVKGNSSSGNNYTPVSDFACGLLIYQADGVKSSSNNFFANEKNQCNFGKGGGQFNPAL